MSAFVLYYYIPFFRFDTTAQRGDLIMQIRSLNATFGRLERRTLELSPGLNIIEAPNEAGKSTLTAFLRVMLYGLPTRERGAAADKNLYAPWSGSAMQGRLELALEDGTLLTLTRDTARANAPMGRFSAVYTGTGEPAVSLTAADCGETLTGVPREVYERSAFIRQSGLAVDSSAELDRRIAALITTGEEGVSYTEAEAVLRRQLNARRHNKTGRIPVLDAEIDAAERALSELRSLAVQQQNAEAVLAERSAEAEALRETLARHDRADEQDRFQAAAEAKELWQKADAEAEQFYRLLRESKTPGREALSQSRARLDALGPLKEAADAAATRRGDAEDALSTFDTAPTPHSHSLLPYSILSALVFLACTFISTLPDAAALAGQLASFASLIALFLLDKRRRKGIHAREDERGVLEQSLREARADADARQRLYIAAEQELLAALPVSDLTHAAAYISENLSRWDRLDALTREAQAAQVRYETLSSQLGVLQAPDKPVERPAQSREALRQRLAACEAERHEAQRQLDYAAGHSRAIGDPAELEALAAEKRRERDTLQDEYNAIALAMDALGRANTSLQNRFSPALGKRAAELFGRLTGGRYQAVLLDRSFHAAAEETGTPVARDVLSLSQGAADQLYLAVRLAICELVLPAEKSVPLVLDDALTNFDDERCAAALDLLLEFSRTRQILLLTCQHREVQYLSGRDGVHVLTL